MTKIQDRIQRIEKQIKPPDAGMRYDLSTVSDEDLAFLEQTVAVLESGGTPSDDAIDRVIAIMADTQRLQLQR